MQAAKTATNNTPPAKESRQSKLAAGMDNIVESFREYFEIVPAVTPALKETVFKIRFSVYAEELGWEDRQNFPSGLEMDAYDKHSMHCLLKHRPSETFIGCVRLVLNNPDAPTNWFPIEECFGRDFLAGDPRFDGMTRNSLGEISRIAVLSSFRHRAGEKNRPNTDIEDAGSQPGNDRRRFPHIALGLYLAAAAMGISMGKSAVFAMMEPKLARRLRIFGIRFEQLGEPIEHRGLRAPYRVCHEHFGDDLSPPIEALLDFIQTRIDEPSV